MPNLTTKLAAIPSTPGVYIYKDAKGRVLYVGKAKLLRTRVKSYFRKNADLEPSKQEMVKHIDDIETISVDTETEALILEANLIRKHQPPYNVVLRDDKYYLFIKITTKEEKPRVFAVRRIKKDGSRYFGPFSSARSVRQTLKLLRRVFPHQGETTSPREVVFPHPLFSADKKVGSRSVPAEEYASNIQNIIRFLQGNRQEIIDTLTAGMKEAAEAEQYERASIFRDQLQAIERLEGNQKVFLPKKESFDVISIARAASRSAANVFQVRSGKLLGKQTFLLSHRSSASLEDTLRQFLLQYYRVAQDIPSLILVPQILPDQDTIASFIHADAPPVLAMPERGKKRQLLTMGETNAQLFLDEQEAIFQTDAQQKQALQELAQAIGLEGKDLHRIETYDVSNIQGKLPTASMVVFIDGAPDTGQYRKFRLEIDDTPNDFAMLAEALTRRLANHQDDWPLPDLIMIDGGKGQLSSAKKVLDTVGLSIPLVSLAKREEELFVPGNPTSIRLPYNSPALYLVQRMRDEAHRFTITYHRLLRSKQQRLSILDEIPGIGPKTKKQLLTRFGSLKGVRGASDEELIAVIGDKKTKTLRDYL